MLTDPTATTDPTARECTCTIRGEGSRYEARILDRVCPSHGDPAPTRADVDDTATEDEAPTAPSGAYRVAYRVETARSYRRRIAHRVAIFAASHSTVAGVAVTLATLAG